QSLPEALHLEGLLLLHLCHLQGDNEAVHHHNIYKVQKQPLVPLVFVGAQREVLDEGVREVPPSPHVLVVLLDRVRQRNPRVGPASIRVPDTALHRLPTVGFVDGGTHGNVMPVLPLHIKQGVLTDPAHFPSSSPAAQCILRCAWKPHTVRPDGPTGPKAQLVEMAEKLGAGVKAVHKHMVPRAEMGHLEQADNCVKAQTVATRRLRDYLVDREVARVTILAVDQDEQLVAPVRGLRTLGYQALINYKVLVWVVVC